MLGFLVCYDIYSMKIGTIYESLISERLTNVDEDVNQLYIKYFEYDVNELASSGFISSSMFLPTLTDTSTLKTEESMKANEINPCKIHINETFNYYDPKNKKIGISVSQSALRLVRDGFYGKFQAAVDHLGYDQQQTFLKEFNEERIKGSIHHELAHWIDDTMNNGHINKLLNKAREANKSTPLGNFPINASKFEIQAQIHNVKQLHNKYHTIWDSLSFNDMIEYSPVLSLVYNQLKGDIKIGWVKNLKKRMHREGLLGKIMG